MQIFESFFLSDGSRGRIRTCKIIFAQSPAAIVSSKTRATIGSPEAHMENSLTPEQLIAGLPEERRGPVSKLRKAINDNLPEGFEETVGSGMLNWVVPHSMYPAGYHCNPKQPLPFLSLASQKSHIAVYHMGVYSSPELLEWFTSEWPKHSSRKLDMGKSCIKFKKPDDIPVGLVGELVSKITPADWIGTYERVLKR
jgi:hypothetical protein